MVHRVSFAFFTFGLLIFPVEICSQLSSSKAPAFVLRPRPVIISRPIFVRPRVIPTTTAPATTAPLNFQVNVTFQPDVSIAENSTDFSSSINETTTLSYFNTTENETTIQTKTDQGDNLTSALYPSSTTIPVIFSTILFENETIGHEASSLPSSSNETAIGGEIFISNFTSANETLTVPDANITQATILPQISTTVLLNVSNVNETISLATNSPPSNSETTLGNDIAIFNLTSVNETSESLGGNDTETTTTSDFGLTTGFPIEISENSTFINSVSSNVTVGGNTSDYEELLLSQLLNELKLNRSLFTTVTPSDDSSQINATSSIDWAENVTLAETTTMESAAMDEEQSTTTQTTKTTTTTTKTIPTTTTTTMEPIPESLELRRYRLMEAAEMAKVAEVDLLLDLIDASWRDPAQYDCNDWILQHSTALHRTICNPSTAPKSTLATLTLLIQKGKADVNQKESYNKMTPLMLACYNDDDLSIVKLLLENGANETVNDQDADGWTALHHAVLNRRRSNDESLPLVEFLLDEGGAMASLNVTHGWGETPLIMAARRGNRKTAEALKKRGASLEGCNPVKWPVCKELEPINQS